MEDCEEAFVKNPDGHPLVLYLRTEGDGNLSGPTRKLLERVNAADKAAKIKVQYAEPLQFLVEWGVNVLHM